MYDPLNPPFYFDEVWEDHESCSSLVPILQATCKLLENEYPEVTTNGDKLLLKWPLSKYFLVDLNLPMDNFDYSKFVEKCLDAVQDRVRYSIDDIRNLFGTRFNYPQLSVQAKIYVNDSNRQYTSETGLNFGQSTAVVFGLSPSFGYSPLFKSDVVEMTERYKRRVTIRDV